MLHDADLTDSPVPGLGARQQLGAAMCGVGAVFRKAALDE
jgi:hypothetical protein